MELEDITEQEFTGLDAACVDEELAEAVRTYPISYDKSIKELKDQKKKENTRNTGCTHSFLLPIFPFVVVKEKETKTSQRQQVFLPPFLKSSFHLTLRLYVSVHITDMSNYVVMLLCCYVIMSLVVNQTLVTMFHQ